MKTKDEICIIPLYHCNLSCPFCYNLDKLTSNIIIDFDKTLIKVLQDIEKSTFNLIHLNIYGGEIFDDSLSNDYYENFSKFLLTVKEKSSKEVVFKFTTNLIHTNTKRWLALFSKLQPNQVVLRVSFDLCNRFKTKNDFTIFQKNVELYKKYIIGFGMVATKQNIQVFLNNVDTKMLNYFRYLYDNFKIIHITDYVPNSSNYENFLPSDEDLLNFGKYLIDNYPEIDYVKKLQKTLNFESKNEKYNQMRSSSFCNKPVLAAYFPDGKKLTTTCLFCLSGYKYTKLNKKQAIMKRDSMLGCLACKYYRTCYPVCPASFLFTKKKLSTCYLKILLELIDENAIST